MFARNVAFVLISLGSIAELAGCSNGGINLTSLETPQPVSVLFVSPPPTSLAVQASATLVAAATFPLSVPIGSVNDFVTWSLTCGSPGACGAFSPNADEI